MKRLIVFDSTHKAIKVERLLMGQLEMDMIPTPRVIGASCGLSITFNEEDVDCVRHLLRGESKEGIKLYAFSKEAATEISWED